MRFRVGVRLHAASPCFRSACTPRRGCTAARVLTLDSGDSSADKNLRGEVEVLDVSCSGDSLAVASVDDGSRDEGATSFEALMNSVSILMGVGILSIPYALAQGGWATLGVLAVIWAATNHTGKLLVKCQEYYRIAGGAATPPAGSTISLRGDVVHTYEDVAELAFGKKGRDLMTAILYTELVGTCALFLILEKDHAKMIFDALPQLALPFEGLSDTALMAAAAALFIPTTWLPDLSALAVVSAAGMSCSLLLAGLVVYTFLTGQTLLADTAAVHLQSLPVTFGLIAFVFAGHAVFPIIYSGMKPSEQPKFPAVLDATYVIVGAVSVAIGGAGYALYGSGALEEVTGNLPLGPLQLLGTCLIMVSPLSKFALTLEPVGAGADAALSLPRGGAAARGVRTGLGLFALLLAARVPFFGTFMSLLGSFLTLSVSVMFPAAAYLKIYWDRLSAGEKATNYAVVALGAVCAAAGTATALQAVVQPTDVTQLAESATHSIQQNSVFYTAPVFSQLVCHSLCELVR